MGIIYYLLLLPPPLLELPLDDPDRELEPELELVPELEEPDDEPLELGGGLYDGVDLLEPEFPPEPDELLSRFPELPLLLVDEFRSLEAGAETFSRLPELLLLTRDLELLLLELPFDKPVFELSLFLELRTLLRSTSVLPLFLSRTDEGELLYPLRFPEFRLPETLLPEARLSPVLSLKRV